jgi:hypothetical protein
VKVINDTDAISTFLKGVPVSASSQKAFLYFVQEGDTGVHHYALNANFTNAPTVKSISSDVNCSFAGGCTITLAQPGLLSNLLSDPTLNTIRACG